MYFLSQQKALSHRGWCATQASSSSITWELVKAASYPSTSLLKSCITQHCFIFPSLLVALQICCPGFISGQFFDVLMCEDSEFLKPQLSGLILFFAKNLLQFLLGKRMQEVKLFLSLYVWNTLAYLKNVNSTSTLVWLHGYHILGQKSSSLKNLKEIWDLFPNLHYCLKKSKAILIPIISIGAICSLFGSIIFMLWVTNLSVP